MLSPEELAQVLPAETSSFASPVPTQIVSNDEYMPSPQTAKQKQYEARIKALGTELAKKQGTTRRNFFKTAAVMAASFVAMNDTYGPVFGVSRAEAATPEMEAGTRRALAHAIFTPGYDGWMEQVDHAIRDLKPDSMKGYTIGDNSHKELSKHPWRLDDEKLVYPAYEKFVKAGLKNVCIHKGLFPPSVEQKFPHLVAYSDVRDVAQAAKDWPQINFIIYHSAYRWAGGGKPEDAWEQFQKTGRIEWVSDLAEIPEKYGVKNVYGDLGQIFAWTVVSEPRLGAAVMGILGKGLGYDHVVWGTDAVWTGAPQWQIEGLRRLEIPDDMQKKYGFKPMGAAADSPIKNAIFGGTNAKLYNYTPQMRSALENDRFAQIKETYEKYGDGRSNMRYGYVAKPLA